MNMLLRYMFASVKLEKKKKKLLDSILSCDIPVVYQLQCRNKCEQQS
jgi:hypothetical protein